MPPKQGSRGGGGRARTGRNNDRRKGEEARADRGRKVAIGRESGTHPAFSNWVKLKSCAIHARFLFLEARSFSRSRSWDAAGNSLPKALTIYGPRSWRPVNTDHSRSRPSLICPIRSGVWRSNNTKGGMRLAFPPYGLRTTEQQSPSVVQPGAPISWSKWGPDRLPCPAG